MPRKKKKYQKELEKIGTRFTALGQFYTDFSDFQTMQKVPEDFIDDWDIEQLTNVLDFFEKRKEWLEYLMEGNSPEPRYILE